MNARSNKYSKITLDTYSITIIRLLIVYLLYFLMRVIFYITNRDLLGVEDMSELAKMFGAALIFDTSAILYTNAIFILLSILPIRQRTSPLYQTIVKWTYYIPNILAIIVNMGDVVYFRFTRRRTTTAVFQEFSNDNVWSFLRFFVDYWWVTLLGLLIIVIMITLYRRTKVRERSRSQMGLLFYGGSLIMLILSAYLTVGGMRGGFTHAVRPITLSNAAQYINKPEQAALVLNTPFALIRTLGKSTLTEVHYFPPQEAQEIFSADRTLPDSSRYEGIFKGRNVVLIIWESFSREWVGSLNEDIPDYKGYTPFIDSLCTRSYVFDHAYANGVRSIDAMPSILTSIPHVGESFVLSHYSNNKINSIPSLLKNKGYYSAFFHGAENGSMGFEAFAKQIGFDRYFGRTQYNNDKDFDGTWGIWDEKFLQYMNQELGTFKQPFFASVFTLSSHHPYHVPDAYKEKFPKGHIPIHQVIGYTDHSLKAFFASASQEPWYDNTIFILVADHAVPGWLKEYKTEVNAYAVPIIIFDPRGELQGRDHTTTQQLDIMPTLLHLLGYQGNFVAYGHNAFNPNTNHFAFNNNSGGSRLIQGDTVLIYSEEKVMGLYDFRNDRYLKNNLTDQPQYRTVKDSLTHTIKAFIQEYNNRMINNQLIEHTKTTYANDTTAT